MLLGFFFYPRGVVAYCIWWYYTFSLDCSVCLYTASHLIPVRITPTSFKGIRSRTHTCIQPHPASGSLLLQPDGAISQEPDKEQLFSWSHPHCSALTQGETHNLASLPQSELFEPAGEAPRMVSVWEREGERDGSLGVGVFLSFCKIKDMAYLWARVYSKMENVSYKQRGSICSQIVCFMNVKGCFQQVGFISLVLNAYRQPLLCPSHEKALYTGRLFGQLWILPQPG